MSWEELARGVELPFDPELTIPELHPYRLDVPNPPVVDDVEKAARAATVETFTGEVAHATTIAVGAGSRGLTGRVEMLRGTIAALRELGAEPFVVPAMGSHGGATAEGQQAMLASLGITEEAIGAEIRSSMETVVVARTPDGEPVPLDANAAAADRILPVNRVKPHTSFHGPIESGCTKMAIVGFGKQPGAARFHAATPDLMSGRLVTAVDALRATGRLLGGIASVESAAGEVVRVEGLTADGVGGEPERELTAFARTLVPALPFDEIDVLIVERAGKDISGPGMDPNVTGRFWVHGLDDLPSPTVRSIVLLDLTEITGGNANGMGFADFIPASLANKVDFRTTYVNCFTAGPAGMRRSRLPMVLPDEESCIKAALSMCGRAPGEPRRVVRIPSTLHLTECLVSEALLS